MKLSLEALQVLDAIDARGSFAAAAEALYRVPSALTHTVAKLEEELGVTLFVRQGRRARLTPAGELLLEEGRHLLRAAGDLECRVKRAATGWEVELRVAVDGLVDMEALMPLLGEFYAEVGGTRLRLLNEIFGGAWDALVTGRADIAIGAPGDPPPGGGWRTQPLGEVPFVFVVAPGHALAQAAQPLASDVIGRARAIAVADTSRQLLARTSGLLSGQDVLTVPDMAAKTAAHVAGLGVGFLPLGFAEREAQAGRLLMREVVETRPPAQLHVGWRADHGGKALAWLAGRLADPALRARLLARAGGSGGGGGAKRARRDERA